MKPPEENEKDVAQFVGRLLLGVVPVIGGGLAEMLNAVIPPSIEKRRQEWRKLVFQELERLKQKDEGKLKEIIRSDEFQSLLINTTLNADKTHLGKKREYLKNALFNSLNYQNRYDINEQYINFIAELTLHHILVLNFLFINQKSIYHINTYEKLFDFYYNKNQLNVDGYDISTFRFFIKDLESKGFLVISSDFSELKKEVYQSSQLMVQDESSFDRPFIKVAQFGINFLTFIKA